MQRRASIYSTAHLGLAERGCHELNIALNTEHTYSAITKCNAKSASIWLHAMFERLQQQWPTIDPQRLDDLALDL